MVGGELHHGERREYRRGTVALRRVEFAQRLVVSAWCRTPVVADGMIIACAPKREPVFGIKDGGKGLVTDTRIAWSFKDFPSDCVTPLYYQGKLFVLDGDKQMMTCLDPRTGAKKWDGSMGVREIFRVIAYGSGRQDLLHQRSAAPWWCYRRETSSRYCQPSR